MPATGSGPIPARIMLVGEAWGAEEERAGEPFVGASGQELNRMLQEAGILRNDCFVTNLVNARPPQNDLGQWIAFKKKDITAKHSLLKDRFCLPIVHEGYAQLQKEIAAVKPATIIAFGNTAMWALTGRWGIMNWRGSMLPGTNGYKVLPTIHPAAVLREWSLRAAVIADLRRAAKYQHQASWPAAERRYLVRPSLEAVIGVLTNLHARMEAGEEIWLDFDIETRSGHIECFSISWSRADAVCVPLMSYDGREGYWTADEEALIVWQFYRVTTHPLARIRWQNGLYDAQYTYRHWGFVPGQTSRRNQDTMISQHTIFSDQPKALHYQASIYADPYIYWKDEGKEWNPKMAPEQRWRYNCDDCVYTREVGEVEAQVVKKMGLSEPHEFQQQLFWPVLKAMNRGVRVIESNAATLADEVQEQISLRQAFLWDILGVQLNINSPKQMQALFYEDLQQPVIMSRAKKGQPSHPTCDDEALQKIGQREPLLLPITNCVADIRTLGKFLNDFILAKRDVDGRMRCSYNIGGSESGKSAPKTFRLSSSQNAFGSGANLQTIPSEKSKSVGKWEMRRKQETVQLIGDPYKLPNLRSMLGPDPGYTFFDIDLDRADLQVFVWEIEDADFKTILRAGADVHLFHAFILDGKEPPPLDELVESHPKYPDHRGPRKHTREFAKVFCHATDYSGKSRTIAAATGRTVQEIERAQRRYLGLHPNIEPYWKRLFAQVQKLRYVENRFKYRWHIFDRIDESLMGEIVAWIPQSTVSIVINKAWANIDANAPDVEVLLQVHDSLAGQFPTNKAELCKRQIMEQSRIVIPYNDPLVIPVGIGTSEANWGAC